MLAQVLAVFVGFAGFVLYISAFFFPEVHRKNDFIWSGIIFFYALVLWVQAGRITGGVLLGQTASVILLGWLGWQTLVMRRQLTPYDQQTWVSDSGKSAGEVMFLKVSQWGTQVSGQLERLPLPAPLKARLRSAPSEEVAQKPAQKRTKKAGSKSTEQGERPLTPAERKKAEKAKAAAQAKATATEEAAQTTEAPEPAENVPEESVATSTEQPTNEGAEQPKQATPKPVKRQKTKPVAKAPVAPNAPTDATAPPSRPASPVEPPTMPPMETQSETQSEIAAASAEESVSEAVAKKPAETVDESLTETVDRVDHPEQPLTEDVQERSTETAEAPPSVTPTDVTDVPPMEVPTPATVSPVEEGHTVAEEQVADDEGLIEDEAMVEKEAIAPSTEISSQNGRVAATPDPMSAQTPVAEQSNEEDWDQNWADGWADDIADDAATPEPEPSTDTPFVASDEPASTSIWDESEDNQPTVSAHTESTDTSLDDRVEESLPELGLEPESETNWVDDDIADNAPQAPVSGSLDEMADTGADDWDDVSMPAEPAASEPAIAPDADEQDHEEALWDEDWEAPEDAPQPLQPPVRIPEQTPENVTAPFRADEWESSWEEPPTEATAIQQPAIQPTIEPDEPTIDEIVAAANRSLSPEDQVVVDVKAIAIESPRRELPLHPPARKQSDAPSKSPWDDWDDEDSNWAD